MGCLKLPYQKLQSTQEEKPLRVVYRKPENLETKKVSKFSESLYRYRKHYATIFPAEIKVNEDSGATVITQYLGGDAYTAPVIKQNNQYRYLHRDYLGSILAITDDLGIVLEKRHFGAWGLVEYFEKNGKEADFTETILTRGFTGHEHFEEVDAIHMNGRMYNPRLHRFVSPDNFIQDPYNTMSYDRQGYVWNNPLMAKDPTGELGFFAAVLIGALVSVVTNGINNRMNDQAFFKGWGKAALIGAVSGAFSFGIGEAVKGLSSLTKITVQALSHGHLGGIMSVANGGTYGSGFLSGAVGSIVGGAVAKHLNLQGAKGFDLFFRTSIVGGLSGGLASWASGGSFVDGFRNGAISAGLNHALHEVQSVDPAKLKARILKDGRLTLKEANKWYRHGQGETLTVDASKIDLDFVNPNDYPPDTPKGVQTLGRSRDGLVYGGITIENIGNNQLNILPDTYNFEMHTGSNLGTRFRNFATKVGAWVAGKGTPYKIHFKGVNTPNYRVNIPR